MRWIWENRQWLFSGAAVAAIAGVIGMAYRRFHRQAQTGANVLTVGRDGAVIGSPQATGSNITQTINIVGSQPRSSLAVVDAYSVKPSPDEIRENLENLPIYQRALTKDSFLGLKVRWQVIYTDLEWMSDAERSFLKEDDPRPDCSVLGAVQCSGPRQYFLGPPPENPPPRHALPNLRGDRLRI